MPYNVYYENTALLDEKAVREYLSFVAPVPYSNKFLHYASKIHSEARRLSCPLDEYKIRANGAEVFKDYGERLKERSGNNLVNYDEVTDVAFHEYKDDAGRLYREGAKKRQRLVVAGIKKYPWRAGGSFTAL